MGYSSAQAKEFINKIEPLIVAEGKKRGYKIFSTVIAQAIIESASGTSSLGYKYHNYFGLKCGSSWKGKSVNLRTKEEYTVGTLTSIRDNFRVFNSMAEGVAGYYDFISTKRYANLKSAQTAQEYAERLKHSRKAYTTNNQKGTVAIIDSKYIKLPKIGNVKAVIHRKPDDNWIVKSATVSQESDGKFYISVLFEITDTQNAYVADKTNAIGLDYASDGLYVDSNGNIGTNHKYYRESHDKLAKEQRKLSRMQGSKKGENKSNNYIKQLRKVNKIHRHIANQRLDNLHKISTEIANQYDVVCVESLNMKSMSNKGFGNGKATLDNGYGMFLSMLEYKLANRGKYFIKVDKWFPSSQICHCCGTLHPEMKDLHIRTMKCDCGLTISRDQNAAINILNEGLRLLTEAA